MKTILKLYALVFWCLVLSFLVQFIGVEGGSDVIRSTLRGGEYRWDYEAMYAVVNLVWGIYCWKASKQPDQHLLFIDFTIWANVAHAVLMTVVGALRPGEFYHLLIDSLTLFIPAVILLYFRKKLINQKL